MIIDTDDYGFAGIKIIQFPGGEWHADVPDYGKPHVHIFAKIRTWDDFGKYLWVADAIKRQGVKVHTFMPYLPGARQDREQPGFALSAEIYAGDIGGASSTLTAVDVHSQTAQRIYENYNDLRVLGFDHLKWLFANEKPYDAILAADEGAVDRANAMARVLGVKTVLNCKKKRDPSTGRLTGFEVPELNDKTHRNWHILIPDDICDGGGTFLGIINEIGKKAYTPTFDLYVTHGIFSKGLGVLLDPKNGDVFHKVFTTNSWTRELPSDRFQVVDLLPYYLESLTP